MKAIPAGLLDNLVTVYGDTTKTFITSRIKQKTIGGKACIGPCLNTWVPFLDDTGLAPNTVYVSPNNRIFVASAVTTGLARVALYDFNAETGAVTFVGSLSFQVINSPTTTHTIRGFKVYDGPDAATVTGWKIFLATTGSVTANGGLYMAKLINKTDFTATPSTIPTATNTDAKEVYKLENSPFTLTAAAGLIIDRATNKLYLHNGVAATHQFARFDHTVSTGSPGANGVTTALFEFITGNLPALTGTLLLTNIARLVTPQASPNPPALLGQKCVFIMTGTTAYLGLLSELTNGTTNWPSQVSSNYVSSGGDPTINPTPTTGTWIDEIDKMIGNGGPGQLFVKPILNNNITRSFGSVDSQLLESGGFQDQPSINFGGITATQFSSINGWVFLVSTATSQRGVVGMQIAAVDAFGLDYIITKVLDTQQASFYQVIALIRQLTTRSVAPRVYYRTSNFNSQTAGWTEVSGLDLSGLSAMSQVQFKFGFEFLEKGITNPTQLQEAYLVYQPDNEISEKWVGSVDSTETGTPSRTAFELIEIYPTSVPKLYFRAYDTDGVLVANANTVDNAANFQYSTDGGDSWTNLGTVPNTKGTRLRYNWSSPPGVIVVVSLRE